MKCDGAQFAQTFCFCPFDGWPHEKYCWTICVLCMLLLILLLLFSSPGQRIGQSVNLHCDFFHCVLIGFLCFCMNCCGDTNSYYTHPHPQTHIVRQQCQCDVLSSAIKNCIAVTFCVISPTLTIISPSIKPAL